MTPRGEVGRGWLTVAALGSFALMALHLVIPFSGPRAYGYFGAAELMTLAEGGSPVPALLTIGVALLLGFAGLFALSGAGYMRSLPLVRMALPVIGGLLTLRGLGLIPELASALGGSTARPPRALAFSAVALSLGLCFVIGFLFSRDRLR